MTTTIIVEEMAEEIAELEDIDLHTVYRVLDAEHRYLEKCGLIVKEV